MTPGKPARRHSPAQPPVQRGSSRSPVTGVASPAIFNPGVPRQCSAPSASPPTIATPCTPRTGTTRARLSVRGVRGGQEAKRTAALASPGMAGRAREVASPVQLQHHHQPARSHLRERLQDHPALQPEPRWLGTSAVQWHHPETEKQGHPGLRFSDLLAWILPCSRAQLASVHLGKVSVWQLHQTPGAPWAWQGAAS